MTLRTPLAIPGLLFLALAGCVAGPSDTCTAHFQYSGASVTYRFDNFTGTADDNVSRFFDGANGTALPELQYQGLVTRELFPSMTEDDHHGWQFGWWGEPRTIDGVRGAAHGLVRLFLGPDPPSLREAEMTVIFLRHWDSGSVSGTTPRPELASVQARMDEFYSKDAAIAQSVAAPAADGLEPFLGPAGSPAPTMDARIEPCAVHGD